MATYNIPMQMQQRCDTVSNWESYNPILLTGQIGIALDDETSEVVLYKIGDGTTTWNNLTKRVDFTPEEKVALKKFIDAGGGSGGSSVAPSEINGNIINNGEQMVVYDDSQIQTDIASLDNRSVVGKVGQTYFAIGNPGTTSVSPTTNMTSILTKYDTNMTINNGFVSLKKGVKYKINFYVYKQSVGSGDSIILSMKDMSGNTLTDNGYIPSTNFTGIPLDYTTDFMTKDTLVGFYLDKTVNINPAFSCISIEEISRTYSLDPVEYAQNHEINVSTFGISSNKAITANSPVVFDTSNGGVELSNDGYAQLKKDTTYVFSASIYNGSNSVMQTGIRVYDVTNSSIISYIGVNGHSTGTVKYTTSEEIEISISFDVDMMLHPTYTYFTVQEIKNPVIVEYTNLKEISNPLMSSEISQESPIGTIIEYMGTKTPEHYLLCDGSIYNISEYYELTEWIKSENDGVVNIWGGDGITTFAIPNLNYSKKNVTPIMTSDTTPTPYVVTASSVYSGYDSSYASWKLFNGVNTGVYDTWAFSGTTGWVMLDFGSLQTINEYSLTSRNYNSPSDAPKEFKLLGSTDGSIFYELSHITGQTNWGINEIRVFTLSDTARYRYYKLEIISNNGDVHTTLGQLQFYSSNTCGYIKYENTHYAVNQYGGFQEDILFEGNVSTNNTVCTLSYNYNEYDNIYIECSYNNVITLIPVRVASIDSTKKIGLQVLSIGSVDTTGRGSFPTHNSFKLTDSAGNIVITKILGIKGSIPTIIEGGVL